MSCTTARGGSWGHPRRDYSGHRKRLPKVHYGPIGSSNRSLGDATTRDQLAAQHGIIALEMEGAGTGGSSFLNAREWFVVRGISDSRRSDLWHRYAALAAAAYVRAMLAKCLPIESQEEHKPYVSKHSGPARENRPNNPEKAKALARSDSSNHEYVSSLARAQLLCNLLNGCC